MPRYAAFLRGVMPTNARMPELKKAFEAAGFEDVKTVLSSGNVVFSAARSSDASLQKKAEAAMEKQLGHRFLTIVRSIDALRELLACDPYKAFPVPAEAKRIVTFLREQPETKLALPIEMDGCHILLMKGSEVFTVYERTPKGGGGHGRFRCYRRRGSTAFSMGVFEGGVWPLCHTPLHSRMAPREPEANCTYNAHPGSSAGIVAGWPRGTSRNVA